MNERQSEILDRIIKFICDIAGVTESGISEETMLEADLGVSGDDAVEFLVASEGGLK